MSFLFHVLEYRAVCEFGVLFHSGLHCLLCLTNVELFTVRGTTLNLVDHITFGFDGYFVLGVNEPVSESLMLL